MNTLNEDRVDKQVPEEDLRAPEGSVSYGDLVALVKVQTSDSQLPLPSRPTSFTCIVTNAGTEWKDTAWLL
jgi:hypothetical protein